MLRGSGSVLTTIVAPDSSAGLTTQIIAFLWYRGAVISPFWSGPNRQKSRFALAFHSCPPWVSRHPFGRPVDPEV